jgi:hypothetical protein
MVGGSNQSMVGDRFGYPHRANSHDRLPASKFNPRASSSRSSSWRDRTDRVDGRGRSYLTQQFFNGGLASAWLAKPGMMVRIELQ